MKGDNSKVSWNDLYMIYMYWRLSLRKFKFLIFNNKQCPSTKKVHPSSFRLIHEPVQQFSTIFLTIHESLLPESLIFRVHETCIHEQR